MRLVTKTRSHRCRRRSYSLVGTSLLLFAAACSSGSFDSSTAFDLPQALSVGGPVLIAPRVQPIYFDGFPYPRAMDAFLTALAASTYWPIVTSEYGVGPLVALPGTPGPTIPSSINDVQLASLLAETFAEGSATLGPPRDDTIYALFFDPATTLRMRDTVFCSSDAASAYHDEWTIAGTAVAVAVIATCNSLAGSPALTGIDVLTPAVSHELVEAATDPFSNSNPAYTGIDIDHVLWALVMNGAEVADLCQNEQPSLTTPADLGHPVQRIWSNANARAGRGPCVPVPPDEVYFNAVATMGDRGSYTLSAGGSERTYSVPVVNARIGETAKAEISFRGGPAAPSALFAAVFEVDDLTRIELKRPMPELGTRGQMALLEIAKTQSKVGVVPLVVGTTDAAKTAVHYWVGGVNRN